MRRRLARQRLPGCLNLGSLPPMELCSTWAPRRYLILRRIPRPAQGKSCRIQPTDRSRGPQHFGLGVRQGRSVVGGVFLNCLEGAPSCHLDPAECLTERDGGGANRVQGNTTTLWSNRLFWPISRWSALVASESLLCQSASTVSSSRAPAARPSSVLSSNLCGLESCR